MPCGRILGRVLRTSWAKATERPCYELDFLEMGEDLEVIDWE